MPEITKTPNHEEAANHAPLVQVERLVMPVVGGKVEIIYKHNKPYGIRDISGFLFFFTDVSKFSGQEERYRKEVEQQFRLADFLLGALKKA